VLENFLEECIILCNRCLAGGLSHFNRHSEALINVSDPIREGEQSQKCIAAPGFPSECKSVW
jgi:hypothetical protein